MSGFSSFRTAAPTELSNSGLVLLWGNSPNGWKPTYLLEALRQDGAVPEYTVIQVDLLKGEQFQDWFIKVNPNSKMPALLHNREDGKKPLRVFESANILLYLADKFDKAYKYHFENEDLEVEMKSWVFWSQANLGPIQGQVNHFTRYAAVEPQTYSINRFNTECHRIYKVLEDHLAGKHDDEVKDWVVGGKLSLADMVIQPWVRCHFWGGISLETYPSIQAWLNRVEALPVIQAALQVPVQDLVTRVKSDPNFEKAIMERMKKDREEKEQAAAAKETKA
ncbi:hypothetical protein JCM11641_002650 [Rhodosporidiobolus odoratus]